MLAFRLRDTAAARAHLRDTDPQKLVPGITSAPVALSVAGHRTAVHPHSTGYGTFVTGTKHRERCHSALVRSHTQPMRGVEIPLAQPIRMLQAMNPQLRQPCAQVPAPQTVPATGSLSVATDTVYHQLAQLERVSPTWVPEVIALGLAPSPPIALVVTMIVFCEVAPWCRAGRVRLLAGPTPGDGLLTSAVGAAHVIALLGGAGGGVSWFGVGEIAGDVAESVGHSENEIPVLDCLANGLEDQG